MNTERVKFTATTMKPKEHVGDSEMPIGSFNSGIHGMLNYLHMLGISITGYQLYKIKEITLPVENANNLIVDYKHRDIIKRLKSDKFPIHIILKRISPNQRTLQ